VLFVCTGNICRSPMAQSIAAWRLRQELGPQAELFAVTSAGTAAMVGAGMEPAARAALADHGIPAQPTKARPLDRLLVTEADLILAAAREHRAAVARLVPRAVQRCFTMTDFDRLARAVDPTDLSSESGPAMRARQLVHRAGQLQGTLPPAPAEDIDVPDPYGLPDEHFTRCADQLLQLTAYWPRLLAYIGSA